MFLWTARLSLIVLAAFVVAAPTHAQAPALSADPYVVADVEVDASAVTAAQARDVALAEGQRRAFNRLLRRLTLGADHGRLPKVDDLTLVVQGIEVEKERTSPTRYIATLNVRFNKTAVRDLLKKNAIPFSETLSRPLLVLPVYRAAGALTLWDDPNPWRAAWAAIKLDRDAPVPLVIPSGRATDITAIGATQALEGERARLNAIAGLYGATDVLVAFADLEVDLGASAERLQVSFRRYGAAGPQVVVESYASRTRGSETDLINRAIVRAVALIEEGWKRDTLIRFEQERRLSVRIPANDIGQWLDVRSRLDAQSLIQRLDVTAVTTKHVQVTLHYWGELEHLALALSQSSLRLAEVGGFWSLQRVSGRP